MTHFLWERKCNPTEIPRHLRQVYDDTAFSHQVQVVRKWFHGYQGWLLVWKPSSLTTDVNVERVHQLVRANRHITQDKFVWKCALNHLSTICSRWVHRLLIDEHVSWRNSKIWVGGVLHYPHSTDLAPCNFPLFGPMKKANSGDITLIKESKMQHRNVYRMLDRNFSAWIRKLMACYYKCLNGLASL